MSLVLTGTSVARSDWPVAAFFALSALELGSVACAGVFVGDSWLGWAIHGWVRRIALTDVQVVEVHPAAGRGVWVYVWVDDRRIAVGELGRWTSPARARDFASRLTTGLQARGADAGMYDAIADQWPIAPRWARERDSSP